jgi:hypothetical protein
VTTGHGVDGGTGACCIRYARRANLR